ncbi:uncharacterized protein LOC100838430 [Brachypodium distachyon]|uniref:SKP1 component dimerisation domain-containing protein n=1 Tax=Brachypodium distachyon TaxID=15368 RepID=I1IGV7_BRADI|nr:uncharacterized protein LOC100838430 [Brachypodium distachyon]KQJ86011.1 hypothetical protein BRADI_4g02870v3 [Brachypodium distachyon]|eukprot:XP_010238875.1 uncharacterized protein LOC100838430 [Brachypodium distachyon]
MAGAARQQLRFSDGSVHNIEAGNAADVLRRYPVVGAQFARSRRIFDLVAQYAEEDAAGDLSVATWNQRLRDLVTDIDTLHDIFLASSTLGVRGLMLLCAKMAADVVRGGTVEEIRSLLGINGDDLGISSEQDLLVLAPPP